MKSIEFLGAAGGEVTGSSFVATTNNDHRILIDAGMFQGARDNSYRNRSLGVDPRTLNAIIITHGHIDHVGLLPLAAESDVPIYMTEPTYRIANIALRNSAKLSRDLYSLESVDDVLSRVTCVPYDAPVKIDGASVTFRDAGHILGSSTLEVQESGERVVFSGDLGNSPSRLVRPTALINQADVIVMETTYGDRLHRQDDPREVILDAISRIRMTRGTLLIPAFAIDRTQMILNILKGLKDEGKLGRIPVFLDSPMAIDITEIYDYYKDFLGNGVKDQKNPFRFDGLEETRYNDQSDRIRKRRGPKIIIAGSGMMSGGRIGKHALDYLADPKNAILFVGYAAEGTPSRAITEGEKEVEINDENVVIKVPVRAKVLRASMSAHADQEQLFSWLKHIHGGQTRLRNLFLVHGNNQSREAFAKKVQEEQLDIDTLSLPDEGEIKYLQSKI